ncbi:MAG TPA: hypothetical protein VMR34_00335 [Candidatus Saccharimonadales bacterium]|nr:hypothetical protein [Candidatus Saccharimonadales bacterium]
MPKLEHLSEFKHLLLKHNLSPEARSVLDQARLILMVGPTAVGRNTVITRLAQSREFEYLASDTTREPRVNNGVPEQNGREYWFKSEREFLEGLKNHHYLEAAIIHGQQVSGINTTELLKIATQNKIAITDIEVQGSENILKLKSDTVTIFLLPPTFEEWMSRLNNRGEMSEQERERRLNSAKEELEGALEANHYIFLVNNEFEETVRKIKELLDANVSSVETQQEGRAVATKLLVKLL